MGFHSGLDIQSEWCCHSAIHSLIHLINVLSAYYVPDRETREIGSLRQSYSMLWLILVSLAAKTKYCRLGGLTEIYFLTVLEAGKSDIMVGFWWAFSSWLANGYLLALPSHSEEREGMREEERDRKISQERSSFSYKDITSIMEVLPSWSLKGPLPKTITLGFRASIYKFFWGPHKHPVHNNTMPHMMLKK